MRALPNSLRLNIKAKQSNAVTLFWHQDNHNTQFKLHQSSLFDINKTHSENHPLHLLCNEAKSQKGTHFK